jgi:hypothetical protein
MYHLLKPWQTDITCRPQTAARFFRYVLKANMKSTYYSLNMLVYPSAAMGPVDMKVNFVVPHYFIYDSKFLWWLNAVKSSQATICFNAEQ